MLSQMQNAFIRATVQASQDIARAPKSETRSLDKALKFKRQFIESVTKAADRIKVRPAR